MNNFDLLKKKILYRSGHRGTKEMSDFKIPQENPNFIIWNFNFALFV